MKPWFWLIFPSLPASSMTAIISAYIFLARVFPSYPDVSVSCAFLLPPPEDLIRSWPLSCLLTYANILVKHRNKQLRARIDTWERPRSLSFWARLLIQYIFSVPSIFPLYWWIELYFLYKPHFQYLLLNVHLGGFYSPATENRPVCSMSINL